MTEQEIEAVEDDGDDVVIIGDVMPKPMTSHDKKKPKRQVEFKSKYKKESLVITQKVKVKKQKYQCISKKVKVNDIHLPQDSKKNNKCVNGSSELKDKCERYAPVCMRKTCKDIRYRVETRSGMTTKRGRTNRTHHSDFPRDLKRMLSPVSSSPLERDLSFDLEISLDTSSLQEMKESKLDTLIKRTRDRDRKNQMTRTQYLFTPPHVQIPDENITENIKTSDTTDYKPLYTSTPKYEENDENKSSIASNNNIMGQSKTGNSPSMKDIHLMFSPIKKADDVPILSTNCKEQGSQCFSSFLNDTNIQDTKSDSANATSSNMNYEQNRADTTFQIFNNIKEEVSKCKILSIDMQILKKQSEHVQTDVSNVNQEQSNNNMPICNTKQSIKDKHPFLEDKQNQHNSSKNLQTVVFKNHEQNIADRMSISNNNDIDLTNKTFSPSLETTQKVHKKSEYTQTVNFGTDYEQNVSDTRMLVSNSIVDQPNKSLYSEQLQIQHQSCDIQTIVTNTKELLINDRSEPNCNNNYVPSIENPLCKDVQNKKTEYQTVSLQHNEQNIEISNMLINKNALATIEHTSFIDERQARHKVLPDMQTTISEKNIAESRMSIPYSNNNIKEQACTPNSLFNYNMKNIKLDEHMNSINSNTKYERNIEEIDMSISYNNDDDFAEQPFTHIHTYEDAHLQHRQSELYFQAAVENTNYRNNNDFNRPDDFQTNYKQVAENNQMSIYFNNFEDQQNTYRNLFVDDKNIQQKTFISNSYYEQNNNFTLQPYRDSDSFHRDIYAPDTKYVSHTDINSAHCNKYYKQTIDGREKPSFFINCSEQRNRSHSPFFEDSHKQFGYRNQEHNKSRNMAISDDINFREQQNRAFFEDINKQHKKSVYTFTDYSNKKYEQTRSGSNPKIYNNNSKEQQKDRHGPYFEKRQHNKIDYNYSAYSNRKQEQIRNMSTSYDNNSFSEHQTRSRRWFSGNNYDEQSDYIRTTYTNKHSEQNMDNESFKAPARHGSPFYDGVQQKKYKQMHTDDSRKTYEQNVDDSITSTSYKKGNFRENSSKRHSPYSYKKSKYYEQRIEERKVSITNKDTYFEQKRNRGYSARVEDRHKKSVYTSVFKKKVEIFIDKRMSDEAYEDVLVGLPPGRVSPDLY